MDFDFSHIIEKATQEQVDRIFKIFLKAVEKEGLYCGGGYKEVSNE
jgi:hypothetical protein